jgi:hypothetical protein
MKQSYQVVLPIISPGGTNFPPRKNLRRKNVRRFDFEQLLGELQTEELLINRSKGAEYAQDSDEVDDALLNFKRAAEFLGISPLQVCVVYMYKHFAAIASYAENGEVKSNEDIHGRVNDLRLYSALFVGLVKDSHSPDNPFQKPFLTGKQS